MVQHKNKSDAMKVFDIVSKMKSIMDVCWRITVWYNIL